MKRYSQKLQRILFCFLLFILILDTKTASIGVKEGIHLCLNVIIPSLFPFFFVTTYLNQALHGLHIPGLQRLGQKLGIPTGAESILLLGFLGGYPVGAQAISEIYRQDCLDRTSAQRLLGFCSNAGPAFIFGITSMLFSSPLVPWVIWFIHILSALLVGFSLPHPCQNTIMLQPSDPPSIMDAFHKSITITTSVCGWIVLFRTLITYLKKYCRIEYSQNVLQYLVGYLELSNGCIVLSDLQSESLCFLLCLTYLAFGGFCVAMQTASVTADLGLGLYIPGKILQTIFSVFLAVPTGYFLFGTFPVHHYKILMIYWIGSLIALATIGLIKNSSRKHALHGV